MNLSVLDNVLWAASLVGHVALVIVLILRKKVREFPVFFMAISFLALSTVSLFLISRFGTKHQYFQTYWITSGVNYLVQVGLLIEIARIVLRPTGRWVLEARKSFLLWGALGLIVAAAVAFEVGPTQSKGFELWATRLTMFTDLMTCGLFLAMMTAANRLGLLWRNQVFAIGQGLFVWAFIELLADVAHTALGWNREFIILDHVQMFAYLAVVIFWSVTFWLPERARAELSPEIRNYLVAAARKLEYDSRSINMPRP